MLYLITNRKLVHKGTLFSVIKNAVEGGVDAIILREKDLPAEKLLPIAEKIKEIIEDHKTLLIINRNFDVAQAVNADGYHTGFWEFMEAKPGWNGLLGVSVHNLQEAILAEKHGAGYVLASHIFETDCKKGLQPKGACLIKDIKARLNIPVIALGGIKPENTREVLQAGADGIAVMSSIMASEDPYTAAQEFKDRIKQYSNNLKC
ncbi:MAG: thiamine-phosphate diphosphorylase [Clostridiales bacterium]|jgi:thiamine-phosphate pyrophosphorylase|nr:thiamine-phosphate diphosphorylase [Clostridiales bacterium]